MKHIQTHKLSLFILSFLMFSVTVFAQKESKDYKETFNVNEDVVIDINTSHADIEFETWNKNLVEIEATLEVEGLSKEEAEDYFNSWAFEVVGNSSKVSISTKPSHWEHRSNSVAYVSGNSFDFDYHFDGVVAPEVEMIPFAVKIPQVTPVPPLPALPIDFDSFSFDYEAYKQGGDEYLEEWKKDFSENFDENFKENIEKWKEEVKAHKKILEQYKKELEQQREEMNEHRSEIRQKQHEVREERRMILRERLDDTRERRREALEAAKEHRRNALEEVKKERKEAMININAYSKPNVFYFSSDGYDKNVKVKKTIKVKLPKKAKLKMNIRHGEVKLAENYENINATLSHTTLLASVIDGENSVIEASYSPVLVENWNYGELKVNYVEDVDLKNVKSVKLLSKSSNVVIGNISEDAIINGSFGDLNIKNVKEGFKRLEIVLDNNNAVIVLPESAFDFYASSSDSKIEFPEKLKLDITKKYSNQLAKGYCRNKNSNKNVSVVTTLCDVLIK